MSDGGLSYPLPGAIYQRPVLETPSAVTTKCSVALRKAPPYKMEGAVRCPRKGPLHEFVALERCLEMRERSPEACGRWGNHQKARTELEGARAGSLSPLRSRPSALRHLPLFDDHDVE